MLKLIKKNKFINRFMQRHSRLTGYIKRLLGILRRKDVSSLAPYIAFFILLAFIPIVTLIFEVVFLIVNNDNDFLITLYEILPTHVYTILVRLIDHNPGHISIMTLSNFTLLYLASKIYLSFYNSYLIIYNVKARPHYIKFRLISFINTFLLIILILILTLLTVFSNYIHQYLKYKLIVVGSLFTFFNIIIGIASISSIVIFMMYSIPDIKQRIKDVYQGALFVSFGWIIVSYGFKVYVDNFANYQTVYKTFTSIIVFVVWIYFISYVLIIGISINRVKISTYEKLYNINTINEYTEGSEC